MIDDDEKTRRNGDVLAEWDENFEDLDQSYVSNIDLDDSTLDSKRVEHQ